MGNWRQPTTGLQKYPRMTTAVPVRVSTVDPEIDPDSAKAFFRSAEETTANLSRGGAFIRSWEPLSAGRRVVVTIALPHGGGDLQLVGRVAWTRRELRAVTDPADDAPGYGIEFVAGSCAELRTLDRFLKSLEPGQGHDEAARPPDAPRKPSFRDSIPPRGGIA